MLSAAVFAAVAIALGSFGNASPIQDLGLKSTEALDVRVVRPKPLDKLAEVVGVVRFAGAGTDSVLTFNPYDLPYKHTIWGDIRANRVEIEGGLDCYFHYSDDEEKPDTETWIYTTEFRLSDRSTVTTWDAPESKEVWFYSMECEYWPRE